MSDSNEFVPNPEYDPVPPPVAVATGAKMGGNDVARANGQISATVPKKNNNAPIAKTTTENRGRGKRGSGQHPGGQADKPVAAAPTGSAPNSVAPDNAPQQPAKVVNVPERGRSPDPEPDGFLADVLLSLEGPQVWAYALPACADERVHSADTGAVETLPFNLGAVGDCDCTATGCGCVGRERPGLLYGSVHALSLPELVEVLTNRPELYVAAWKFGVEGDICGRYGDAAYYLLPGDEDGPAVNITRHHATMHYTGVYYPHGWLYSGHVQVKTKDGVVSLRARHVMSGENGMTLFKLRFSVDLSNRSVSQVPWRSAISGSDLSADVVIPKGSDSYSGALRYSPVQVARLHTFFGVLLAWDEKGHEVVVSRAIVGKAAKAATGITRDEIGFRTILVKVGREYDRLNNLPEEMKTLAVPMTAALAFTFNLKNETGVYSRMLKDWGTDFHIYEQVRKFRLPYDLGFLLRMTCYSLTVVYSMSILGVLQPAAPFHSLLHRGSLLRSRFFYLTGGLKGPSDDLSPPSDFKWLPKPYFGMFRTYTAVEELPTPSSTISAIRSPPIGLIVATSPEREPENQVQMLKVGFLSFLSASAYKGFGGRWLTSLWTDQKALVPPSKVTPLLPGSACLFTEDCEAPKYAYDAQKNPIDMITEDCVKFEEPMLQVCGIAFSQKVPFHFKTKSQVVERNMLENRCLLERPEVEMGFYEWMCAEFENTAIMKELVREPVEVDYDAWVNHFPGARKRAEMQDALLSLEAEPLDKADAVRSIFVKVEKSGFIGILGMILSAPRHIVGGKPRYLAATGPSIWAIGNRLKEVFDESDVMYYGARTAESCGRALSNQIERLGGLDNVFFVKGDASRMDAHVHRGTLKKEERLFGQMGATPVCLLAIHSQKAICYTVGGLRLVIEGRRVTGDARTSVGNTLEMAFIVWACLVVVLVVATLENDFGELLQGDDSVAVIARQHYSEGFSKNMTDVAVRLGYRMKFETTLYLEEVEFCSRLFWPTADGLVLGAKIGRWLAKAGYMFKSADTLADYRSQMIGHLQDNWFVPLVSDYCRRVIELIPKSSRRYRETGREGREEDYKIHCEKVHEPCVGTYVFASLRYGLTRDHIEEFQRTLAEVRSLPVMIHLAWMDDIMEVDA